MMQYSFLFIYEADVLVVGAVVVSGVVDDVVDEAAQIFALRSIGRCKMTSLRPFVRSAQT